MVIFKAPYPSFETTMFLPDPEFRDSIANTSTLKKNRALDGTLYTYVKTTGRVKIEWTFDVALAKAVEVEEFYKLYCADLLEITDWESNIFRGIFDVDSCDVEPHMYGEFSNIRLTFEVQNV